MRRNCSKCHSIPLHSRKKQFSHQDPHLRSANLLVFRKLKLRKAKEETKYSVWLRKNIKILGSSCLRQWRSSLLKNQRSFSSLNIISNLMKSLIIRRSNKEWNMNWKLEKCTLSPLRFNNFTFILSRGIHKNIKRLG